MKESIVIINNEKCLEANKQVYCENIEMKSLPEGLGNFHQITYIARTSKIKRSHKINIKKIKIASNIFSYIYFIFKILKFINTKYLIIAIF